MRTRVATAALLVPFVPEQEIKATEIKHDRLNTEALLNCVGQGIQWVYITPLLS